MKRFLIPAFCAMAALYSQAADFTYSDGTINRTTAFRIGDAELQGMAMRLSHDKLQLLKGNSISGVSTMFFTKRTDNSEATIFVTTDLGGTPLRRQIVSVTSAASWLSLPLTEPYIITGDEPELYIGWTASVGSETKLLMADGSIAFENCSFVLDGSQWSDIAPLGRGNANIKAIIDDAPDFSDAILKPLDFEGYYIAGSDYCFDGQFLNFGTVPITSVDVTVRFNGKEEISSLRDINIAPGSVGRFSVGLNAPECGELPLSVTIGSINGTADSDPADNVVDHPVYFYPEGMERTLLLEAFTGQKCPQCPAGHRTITSFLETVPKDAVIEVMHHAGYYPDNFTTQVDASATFFYGNGSSTYAPAFMINRELFPSLGSAPVMNVQESLLRSAYDLACAAQPYAALDLNTSFDDNSRMLHVEFNSCVLRDLPGDHNVVNIILLQDGLVASQSGMGDGYVHNAVCRGSILGNPWGAEIPADKSLAGNLFSISKDFKIGETIFSDYWTDALLQQASDIDPEVPALPENMYVVAYVGKYDADNIAGHTIYNSLMVPLGQSKTHNVFKDFAGTDSLMASQSRISFRIDGRDIVVLGDPVSVEAYSLAGLRTPLTNLAPGIYLVRAIDKAGISSTTKLMIR